MSKIAEVQKITRAKITTFTVFDFTVFAGSMPWGQFYSVGEYCQLSQWSEASQQALQMMRLDYNSHWPLLNQMLLHIRIDYR